MFTGVVATAVFDLMGRGQRGWKPRDDARYTQTGATTVVYDALVVATVVPAQHRYKSFKAER